MTGRTKIRILIVEDSELVRAGIRALLTTGAAAENFELVGEATTVESAKSECARTMPDIVVLDVRLPDGSGFAVCRHVRDQHPGVRVLVLTGSVDDEIVEEAIRSGAHGYFLKDIDIRGLSQAVLDVAEGRFVMDPTIANRVMNLIRRGGAGGIDDKIEQLAPQERNVLALVAQGMTNKEIAAEMGLSDKTVKNYLARIYEKLDVTRRAQAAVAFADHAKSLGTRKGVDPRLPGVNPSGD